MDLAILDVALHGEQRLRRMIAEGSRKGDLFFRCSASSLRIGRAELREQVRGETLDSTLHIRFGRLGYDGKRRPAKTFDTKEARAQGDRCFWPRAVGSLQSPNTKAPETARSPGSAARSNTNASDGSSLMVRGSFSIFASSNLGAAKAGIIPCRARETLEKAGPVRRAHIERCVNEKVAVAIDAAPLAGFVLG